MEVKLSVLHEAHGAHLCMVLPLQPLGICGYYFPPATCSDQTSGPLGIFPFAWLSAQVLYSGCPRLLGVH